MCCGGKGADNYLWGGFPTYWQEITGCGAEMMLHDAASGWKTEIDVVRRNPLLLFSARSYVTHCYLKYSHVIWELARLERQEGCSRDSSLQFTCRQLIFSLLFELCKTGNNMKLRLNRERDIERDTHLKHEDPCIRVHRPFLYISSVQFNILLQLPVDCLSGRRQISTWGHRQKGSQNHRIVHQTPDTFHLPWIF